MIRFTTLLFLCVCVLNAFGEGYSIKIEYLDGSQQEFYSSLIQKITFDNNTLTVVGNDATELSSRAIDEVRKIDFTSQSASGIESETTGAKAARIFVYNNEIHITGTTSGENVFIFDTNGRLHLIVKTTPDENIIGVSALQNGVYILKYGNQIVKFIKQ